MKSNTRIIMEQSPELNLLEPLPKKDITKVRRVSGCERFYTQDIIGCINANIVREHLNGSNSFYLVDFHGLEILENILNTRYPDYIVERFYCPLSNAFDFTGNPPERTIRCARTLSGNIYKYELKLYSEGYYRSLKRQNIIPDDLVTASVYKISW